MTSSSSTKKLSRVATFVRQRLYEFQAHRNQSEVARLAGFENANMLSMIKDGKAKLPLDRVASLATALDVDPGELLWLALEQNLAPSMIALLATDEKYLADRSRTRATATALIIEAMKVRHELIAAREAVKKLSASLDKLQEHTEVFEREFTELAGEA
jgi:hypothetical protein